jgi:hypothetical protein
MSEKLSDKDLKEQLQKEAHGKMDYKFPTEEISLPSNGLVYDEDTLLADGKITMKYMSAKEEDILTSKSLIQAKTVLDKLFQSLIITPIKYNDLLLGDKNKIMIASRILGYGKDYSISVSCPKCKHEMSITVDLQDLTENELVASDVHKQNKNEFPFTLPNSKKEIKFKLLTQGDYQKIKLEVNSLRKQTAKTGISPEATTTLKFTIIDVDGNTDKKYIDKFVDNELLAFDSKELRKEIKRVSPDVNLKHYFVCENTMECEYEGEIDVPMETDFFWPET